MASGRRENQRTLAGCHLVTTDEILTEVLAAFCEAGPLLRQRAATLVRNLHKKPTVTVHPQARDTFLTGLTLYEARPDKEYSLTDCVSMEINKVSTMVRRIAERGPNLAKLKSPDGTW